MEGSISQRDWTSPAQMVVDLVQLVVVVAVAVDVQMVL